VILVRCEHAATRRAAWISGFLRFCKMAEQPGMTPIRIVHQGEGRLIAPGRVRRWQTITFGNRRPVPQSHFPLGPLPWEGIPPPVGMGSPPGAPLGASDPGSSGIHSFQQQLLDLPTPPPGGIPG
jgi:hypothetical protein